jgi:hypothetical protein
MGGYGRLRNKESSRRKKNKTLHPKTDRDYNKIILPPMIELLAYLRANGLKTLNLNFSHA